MIGLLLRTTAICALFSAATALRAQDGEHARFTVTKELLAPGTTEQVMVRFCEAWPFTFGNLPGAELEQVDTLGGSFRGKARINFRSMLLLAREQTNGVVFFRVQGQVRDGALHVVIDEAQHSGNHDAVNGPIHIGPLYQELRPMVRVPGVGRRNADAIHDDARTQLQLHVDLILRDLASRMARSEAP